MKKLVGAAFLAAYLSACGGGGGGGGSVPGGSGGGPVQPSVSGDMLSLAASRGWNYQIANLPNFGPATVSTYVDPTTLSNGSWVLVGTVAAGLVPTALTSHNAAESNAFGGLALLQTSAGWTVLTEVSAGSTANVPGSPLLVGNTLTQGAVSNPYPGVTETVLSVGSVPGSAACPVPNATGATVQYVYQNITSTVSYVPGCGITAVASPNGTFTLVSIGSYPAIGSLGLARRAASASWLTTARSLLGLERNDLPMARIFK